MNFTLQEFTTDDNLSRLFNTYMARLAPRAMALHPTDSMRQTLTNTKEAVIYYELIALNNCLHSLHQCVSKALDLINNYDETQCIYQKLEPYFENVNNISGGELIGSSTIRCYAKFTEMVRNSESKYSFLKSDEMDNETVAQLFEAVMKDVQSALNVYNFIAPVLGNIPKYKSLERTLNRILNVQY